MKKQIPRRPGKAGPPRNDKDSRFSARCEERVAGPLAEPSIALCRSLASGMKPFSSRLLTFVLWLLYRRLSLEAEPAVALAGDAAPEHVDLPKEIA
jgi:hypothetical protein